RLEEAERTQLETAPSSRLKRPEKARSLVALEGFLGEAAQGLAFRCPASNVLRQLVGASEVRLVVHASLSVDRSRSDDHEMTASLDEIKRGPSFSLGASGVRPQTSVRSRD